MEIKADICEGDPDNPRKMHYPEQTVRWEDVLDFAWGEKDGGGLFVSEDGGDRSYVSCWEIGSDDQERFSVECGDNGLVTVVTDAGRTLLHSRSAEGAGP